MPPKPCTDNEKSCKHKQISNSDARCDYFRCSQRVDGVEVKGKVAGLIGSENLRRMHACATDAKATANILMCGGGMEVSFLLGRVQVFICGWVGKSRRSILAMDYKSQSALLVVSPTLPRHADNRPETILTGSEWG
jgi:hypothetical protein